ncbi:unnamed protein product [Alopecurus aequalis]
MSTRDGGADGQGDALLLPYDFDDVLPLLGMSDLDWPGMVGNYYTGDGGAPSVCTQPNGLPAVHGGDPSTSSSATAARQADVLDCSGCQVLREVVHSNGLELAKLCIHGTAAGLFYHATSEVHCIDSEGLATTLVDQSCTDFRGRDYEYVRHYLTKYALQQAAGNHAVVRDSLSMFHHVLCTPMNPGIQGNEPHHREGSAGRDGAVHHAAVVQPAIRRNKEPEQPAGPSQPNHTTHAQVQQQPLQQITGRSALALQRERTRNMQFSDIAPYFHLRISEAAEKLDIRTTALKGISRRVGVQRWPHRKLKKLDKQITELRSSGDGAWARDEIERLNADRKRILHGPQ